MEDVVVVDRGWSRPFRALFECYIGEDVAIEPHFTERPLAKC